jgi:hypothetical protein
MGDYVPLYYSLAIIFLIGILLPVVITSVVDINPDDIGGLVGFLVDIVEEGVSFFTFSFNPFDILGEDLKNQLVNYIASFGYIPEVILYPLLIFVIIGFIYTLVKLLPTT